MSQFLAGLSPYGLHGTHSSTTSKSQIRATAVKALPAPLPRSFSGCTYVQPSSCSKSSLSSGSPQNSMKGRTLVRSPRCSARCAWLCPSKLTRTPLERIADQKFAVKTLTFLYRFSSDIPGRSDTLRDARGTDRGTASPKRFFKRAMKGVRFAATTTTTVLGNVASEIAGR